MASAQADDVDLSETDIPSEQCDKIAQRSSTLPTPEPMEKTDPLTLRVDASVFHELRYSLDEDGDPDYERYAEHVDGMLREAIRSVPSDVDDVPEFDGPFRELTVHVSPRTRRGVVREVRELRLAADDLPDAGLYHTWLLRRGLDRWFDAEDA